MKKQYTPYNFNEEDEYKIYFQIGKKYGKKINNKNNFNEKGCNFDKYTEWEEHFKETFLKNDSNKCNFLHFLIDMLRMYQHLEEIFKALMIPILVAAITIILTIYTTMNLPVGVLIVLLLIGLILIMYVCSRYLYEFGNKIDFYTDCIKIINDEDTSHQ